MTAEIPRRSFLRLAAATAVAGGLPVMQGGRPAYAQPASPAEWEPDAVLEELRAGNVRYLARHSGIPVGVSRREDFAWGQAPRAVVLTCSDSRVHPDDIFDQSRGDLFIVRVAGNGVNEDGLASVEYATAVLGARAVVVLGHSHCGAVEEAKGQPGAKLEDAIAANARLTAQELESSPPFISKAVDKGQVKVVAGVYDLKNGHVDFFG